MNELFGLDRKSIQNKYFLIIYLFMLNSAKTCHNGSKINKNVPKYALFDTIGHKLTLKMVFVLYAKQIGWPVLT